MIRAYAIVPTDSIPEALRVLRRTADELINDAAQILAAAREARYVKLSNEMVGVVWQAEAIADKIAEVQASHAHE